MRTQPGPAPFVIQESMLTKAPIERKQGRRLRILEIKQSQFLFSVSIQCPGSQRWIERHGSFSSLSQ